jgi:hypothetical protein
MKIQDILLATPLLLPSVALAAPKTFQELIGLIIDFANLLVPILIGIAVLLYFWNISKTLFSIEGSSDNQEKMREAIVWGLGILFVMVSVWGILNVLKQTFLQG